MKNLVSNLRVIANRVFAPDEYRKFLELAARFPNLSLYNLLFLYYQMPSATLVAGQNAWRDNYGLNVKPDERAISLLKPNIVDEEETTIGYVQIGVFDISQLESTPDIKKEEFSIPEFFHSETGSVFVYDNEDILGDKDYDRLDDSELLVKRHDGWSEEENQKFADAQILSAYVDEYCDLDLDGQAKSKILAQSIKYILCARYDLPRPKLNNALISNCKSFGMDLLYSILSTSNMVIETIENRDTVELNFVETAFINLLVEANSKEDYEAIKELDIEDDDEMLNICRESFVEKMGYLNPRAYNAIYEDRQNNKMLTQPPYKIKLFAEI